MSLLRRMLGMREDPTADWPLAAPRSPELDLGARRIGPLPFGASLDRARAPFGKPDRVRWSGDDLVLIYTGAGFRLEFADGARLDSVSYFVSLDPHDEDADAQTQFSHPVLIRERHLELRPEMGVEDIIRLLGSPTERDDDDDEDDPDAEVVLTYRYGELQLEVELELHKREDRLKRLAAWSLSD